jgi:hypothetical protein
MPNSGALWALTLPAATKLAWIVHWHADVVPSRIRLPLRVAYALYRPFEQAVLERAARIVATSPPYLRTSEPLQPWLFKCAVVPLGLKDDGSTREVAGASPRPPQALRLLSIGRLSYYKDFETLIRAAASLPGVQLTIAGDGEMRAALDELIASLPMQTAGAVQLLGRVDEADKRRLLRECDVVCLSSCERTEAFGLVLLEAMRLGRPCIAADLAGSGVPWLIGETGGGLLAPVRDVDGWRRTIARLRDDPALRDRLGAAGRASFAARFTIDACVRRISEQYDRCLVPIRHRAAIDRELIVIPARDEATTVGALVARLKRDGWREVVVVDDQSTDGTSEVARVAGATVLRPLLPVGAWGATQAGIRLALARGYEGVVTMDADGQHEAAEIPALLARRCDADVIIGAHPERGSWLRRIAWWWFRRLTGFELRDLTSGFRYYNRAAMELLASHEATLLDYQDLGALLLMSRAGMRTTEVPVSMGPRTAGKSRVFRSWFSVARYMTVTTLLCLSRWDLPSRRASR